MRLFLGIIRGQEPKSIFETPGRSGISLIDNLVTLCRITWRFVHSYCPLDDADLYEHRCVASRSDC